MVASISARGSAAACLHYYNHLQRDDYYSREGEPPGRWAGRGAERLSLVGPVTPSSMRRWEASIQRLASGWRRLAGADGSIRPAGT
jgi:TrwC relaxase